MIFRRCLITFSGVAIVALGAGTSSAFASAAAPGAAGSSAPVVVTVAPPTSASTRPTAAAPRDVVINGVSTHCFSPGIIYSVNTTGIHVRASPGGSSNGSIGKGRWFDSDIFVNGAGPYHCLTLTTIDGQYWVLGAANYNVNLAGYVGLNYLNFVKYVN